VSEGDYGVPSRIEDDELLNLVIPLPEDFAYAEERRLFYVALTRASRGTFLLTNNIRPSRYIRELCEVGPGAVRFETAEGRKIERCPKCHEGNTIKITESDGSAYRACSRRPACDYKFKPAKRNSAVSRAFRNAGV
jgi:DNA helicase-4